MDVESYVECRVSIELYVGCGVRGQSQLRDPPSQPRGCPSLACIFTYAGGHAREWPSPAGATKQD